MYKINAGGESGADICSSSTHCQAFCSLENMRKKWGENFEGNYNKLYNAVYSTKGMIITYNGNPIEVLYHSSSGGMTENSENVFASARPYLKSVLSSNEQSYSSKYYGQKNIPISEFIKTMNEKGAQLSSLPLTSQISGIKRYESGRIKEITIGKKRFTGKQIRGYFGLNSANFSLQINDETVSFKTVGYGHGVGMSQTGANAMAASGADFKEILHHYYTDVDIELLN